MEKYELGNVDLSSDIEQNDNLGRPNIMKKMYQFSDGYMEENGDFQNVEPKMEQVDSQPIEPSTMEWLPWAWYRTSQAGFKVLQACDYVGETLANFLGITSPKYQFEIDEYYRMKAQQEEESKKEKEESFGWHNSENKNELITSENTVGTHV